jgi:hypothetical protein
VTAEAATGDRGARGSPPQRGSVAVVVGLMLPVLLACVALAVDVGHIFLVRGQLQNAADAAALAGARTLDGTTARFAPARQAAQRLAACHTANGTAVAISTNDANAQGGDVVLGRWHPEGDPPFFEHIASPATIPPYINAVRVHTQRTGSAGGSVVMWLAQAVGFRSADVGALATAVSGGGATECAFPLALPDCLITTASGSLVCGAMNLVFRNDPDDNAGLTDLASGPPVNGSIAAGLVNDARNGVCHAPTAGSPIYLQNGTDVKKVLDAVDAWIAANGGRPVTVTMPVLASGLTGPGCNVKFNRSLPVGGFARVQLVRTYGPPDSSMDVNILCSQPGTQPGGGGFFGQSSLTYLAE